MQVMVLGLRKSVALRVKQATMDFVVWVFKHATDAQMAAMAPIAFKGIISTLQGMDPGDGSSGAPTLRGFLYQAVGQLAEVRHFSWHERLPCVPDVCLRGLSFGPCRVALTKGSGQHGHRAGAAISPLS